MLPEAIEAAEAGQDASFDTMQRVVDEIMQGQFDDQDVGRWLLALKAKGESIDEIAGAAAALRRHMVPIRCDRMEFVDTCGTGGDHSGTFNISTAAAIVTAASGLAVAKHGNRSITSRTGSADVLAELGINVDADVPTAELCLRELGICFCFAPKLHPAMKHVSAVRKALAVPTLFNLLGPLCNPAAAPFQLLGVGRAELRPLLAAALARLGTRRAAVVSGQDGLDEVTLATATDVVLVENGQTTEMTWSPADFGLAASPLDRLIVDGPQQSAEVIRRVLDGQTGPARDIVVLNAAAAIAVARPEQDRGQCRRQAEAAVDSGAARQLLADWGEASR